jgi:hypothetical protein
MSSVTILNFPGTVQAPMNKMMFGWWLVLHAAIHFISFQLITSTTPRNRCRRRGGGVPHDFDFLTEGGELLAVEILNDGNLDGDLLLEA